MAAPLIVRTAEDARADVQEVVVLLHDFTFRDPAEILAGLGGVAAWRGMPGMRDATERAGCRCAGRRSGDAGHGVMDLNDIDFDAYLANDRTLADPLVVRTERGGRVRLRLINGASATAFWIDLGALDGDVVAVDGDPVQPVAGARFPLAQGAARRRRLSACHADGGAFPVLAQREGDRQRTGIILATQGAAIAKVARVAEAHRSPPRRTCRWSAGCAPPQPLAAAPRRRRASRRADRHDAAVSLVDQRPHLGRPPAAARVAGPARRARPRQPQPHGASDAPARPSFPGDRDLNGRPHRGAHARHRAGAGATGRCAIAFDADNPGRWLFHCHNLYHMATGMMTEVAYDNAA